MTRVGGWLAILGLVAGGSVSSRAHAMGPIDYAREVKPLLAKHCVGCHGATKPRGGLRLDTAEAARKGGKSGPAVVPGEPDDGTLLEALAGGGSIRKMPLNRPGLNEAQVQTLRDWIRQGAKAPANEVASVAPEEVHWAFVAPKRPALPGVGLKEWPRNPIDTFILQRLEQAKLTPSPEADRVTLIRRLSLDLIGLPPTPAEVDAFLLDHRPDAYERVVDRLLASPHYGERWGRLWLDQARYADSNGFNIDAPRNIWKYRDWVIDALNRDLPYDRFVVEQVAGDLLPDSSKDQLVATGFHRNTLINQEGGIDLEQFRNESVHDRVSTTGTVFLGLTVGCAQCHDHKYDPISQKEYYRLFAFYNSCDEPELDFGTTEELTKRDAVDAQLKALEAELKAYLPTIEKTQPAWEKSLSKAAKDALKPELREILDLPTSRRNPVQQEALFAAYKLQEPGAVERQNNIDALKARRPNLVATMIVRERSQPRESFVHVGGDFTRKGEVVTPGTPASLPPIATRNPGKPDRLDLARWLVDRRNPLTARVAVNRVWQEHFGRGLVETENDFGTQGSPPSHPELLDWLAVEFLSRGWSVKSLHRLIVTSATYRQASTARQELASVDPGNRLLGRMSRLRLDAELIRDSALFASGKLSGKVGGPSVFPPQPAGVMTLGQMTREWTPSKGEDRYRRGMYTFFWRATPHPSLMVFDAPESTRTCTRRPRSNTPLQALTLLNDEGFHELALALGERSRTSASTDADRLKHGVRFAIAREPSAREHAALTAVLNDEKARGGEPAAWATIGRVLINLDEFLTRE